MLAAEKSPLTQHLQKLERSIAQFYAADKKQVTDTYWYALCTDSAAARAFFKTHGHSIVNHMAVCSLAASVYHTFILRDALPPVVTRATLDALHGNARALKDCIPTDVPLPLPVQSQQFNAGLSVLCDWLPGPTILNDKKGDSARRWVTRELAIGFALAFNKVPVEFVHALIVIVWPDAPLRSVQRELDSVAIAVIRAEANLQRAEADKASQARATANQIIQRTNRPLVVLDDAQTDAIDKLQAQIDRIKVGMPQFTSEAQHLRAIIALAGSLPDKAMAAEAVQQLSLLEYDYGLK